MSEWNDTIGTKGGTAPTSSGVAYNPYDPAQQSFLSALALGESHGPSPYTQGVGGTDLSGAPTNQYGFPTWGGFGNSHAAGAFQFQPATWEQYGAEYNLNFRNPGDQNAAAWYLAQDTYKAKTGGDLSSALAAGQYSSVQAALAKVWPSVTGNGASPGLAAALSGGQGSQLSGGANPISADTSLLGKLNPLNAMTSQFARIGLIAVGSLILLVALWYLLSQTGAVPSPGEVAKTAGKVALAAA